MNIDGNLVSLLPGFMLTDITKNFLGLEYYYIECPLKYPDGEYIKLHLHIYKGSANCEPMIHIRDDGACHRYLSSHTEFLEKRVSEIINVYTCFFSNNGEISLIEDEIQVAIKNSCSEEDYNEGLSRLMVVIFLASRNLVTYPKYT